MDHNSLDAIEISEEKIQNIIEEITKSVVDEIAHTPQTIGETLGHHTAELTTLMTVSAAVLFMIGLLLLNEIFINSLKQRQRNTGGIYKYLNNTMVTTIVGLLAGCLLKYGTHENLTDNLKNSFSDIFLVILLPPIIFESAINMDSERFFKHFGSILTFALPGTSIATAITAYLMFNLHFFGIHMEIPLLVCIAFGALISATDPVAVLNIFKSLKADKMIFIIIFGESIINDAIAIIFYETTVEIYHSIDISLSQGVNQFIYSFGGSVGVGLLIGLVCAGILKNEKRTTRHHIDNIETIITVTIPWASYLIAFHMKLSGIVSIMFCGIAMARYALPNLSEHGHQLMHLFYHALGYTFESLTFIFMGIVFVTYGIAWDMINVKFFLVITFILVFARFCNMAVICTLVNVNRTKNRLTLKHFLVLWYAGFRGAMATALALGAVLVFKEGRFGDLFLILTLLTAGLNIFIQGIFLLPILDACGIILPEGDDQYELMEEESDSPGIIKKMIWAIDQQIFWEFLVIKPIKDDKGHGDGHEIELQNHH